MEKRTAERTVTKNNTVVTSYAKYILSTLSRDLLSCSNTLKEKNAATQRTAMAEVMRAYSFSVLGTTLNIK